MRAKVDNTWPILGMHLRCQKYSSMGLFFEKKRLFILKYDLKNLNLALPLGKKQKRLKGCNMLIKKEYNLQEI